VMSGVAIICGAPPTGMKSLNSTYWPGSGITCQMNEPSASRVGCREEVLHVPADEEQVIEPVCTSPNSFTG
jgi:hypothetical protein